jgi:hypothetical protein
VSGIAVATLPDEGAPQVGITVDGLDASTASTITVDTSWDGGTTWRGVRGATALQVTSGAFVRDYVPALNRQLIYRLTVVGPTIPGTLQATTIVPSEHAWLQDPLAPRSAVPIDGNRAADAILLIQPTASELVRRQSVDVAAVEGAAYPVASVGQRQAPSGLALVLRAVTRTQLALADDLRALLTSSGVLMLRGLPADVPIDPVAAIVAGDVTEVPVVGNVLGLRNDWRITATVVRPTSMRIAVPWWTYAQVQALWAPQTYDAVKAARPGATYLDFARDPQPPA